MYFHAYESTKWQFVSFTKQFSAFRCKGFFSIGIVLLFFLRIRDDIIRAMIRAIILEHHLIIIIIIILIIIIIIIIIIIKTRTEWDFKEKYLDIISQSKTFGN